jgi:ppGpp synthetase/RelA/SpoT-type nucleotidyltranferase
METGNVRKNYMKTFKQFLFEALYTKKEEDAPQDFNTEVESADEEQERQDTYQQEIEKAKNKKQQLPPEQSSQNTLG